MNQADLQPSISDYAARYKQLAEALPQMALAASLTMCGMNTCVDARAQLDRLHRLFATDHPPAAAFAALLRERAQRGVGGEVKVDWPEGPAWLAQHEQFDYSLGGTGPQAAWVLTAIGAPALVNLDDRSEHMLARVPAGILLAEGDSVVPAGHVSPRGARRPDIHIFDFTKGVPTGGIVPPRSSRIIVRFHDPGLDHDLAFIRLTPTLAATAGAGLVSGFHCTPSEQLSFELDRVFAMVTAWRSSGLNIVHLELGGADTVVPGFWDPVFRKSSGLATSLGMSHSEFLFLEQASPHLADAMLALARRYEFRRICIHADEWVASVTRDDPVAERTALMTGSLLASARAHAGRPVERVGVPPGATFAEPPYQDHRIDDTFNFVCCPSPYLAQPATALGLGDTFTAGCLLALGLAAR